MDIVPIYKRVIGLDVHQAQITGCAITEQFEGSVTYERREFGGFKRDRKALAKWARSIGPDIVVMEANLWCGCQTGSKTPKAMHFKSKVNMK